MSLAYYQWQDNSDFSKFKCLKFNSGYFELYNQELYIY